MPAMTRITTAAGDVAVLIPSSLDAGQRQGIPCHDTFAAVARISNCSTAMAWRLMGSCPWCLLPCDTYYLRSNTVKAPSSWLVNHRHKVNQEPHQCPKAATVTNPRSERRDSPDFHAQPSHHTAPVIDPLPFWASLYLSQKAIQAPWR